MLIKLIFEVFGFVFYYFIWIFYYLWIRNEIINMLEVNEILWF